MQNYLDLMRKVYEEGFIVEKDRTGVGRKKLIGQQLRFFLGEGLPAITTKKVFHKGLIEELIWFLSGSNDISRLLDKNIYIWSKWAVTEEDIDSYVNDYYNVIVNELIQNSRSEDTTGHLYKFNKVLRKHVLEMREDYDILAKALAKSYLMLTKLNTIGDIYGPNWRDLNDPTKDQLVNAIQTLLINPGSSRIIVSSWDKDDLPNEKDSPVVNVLKGKGALAPCPMMYHFLPVEVEGRQHLNMILTQRSLDIPIGGPFNVTQYPILQHLVAYLTDMMPYEFIWEIHDAHIYLNQLENVTTQIEREPYPLPTLTIVGLDKYKELFNEYKHDIYKLHTIFNEMVETLSTSNFVISEYKSHPHIPYEVNI